MIFVNNKKPDPISEIRQPYNYEKENRRSGNILFSFFRRFKQLLIISIIPYTKDVVCAYPGAFRNDPYPLRINLAPLTGRKPVHIYPGNPQGGLRPYLYSNVRLPKIVSVYDVVQPDGFFNSQIVHWYLILSPLA